MHSGRPEVQSSHLHLPGKPNSDSGSLLFTRALPLVQEPVLSLGFGLPPCSPILKIRVCANASSMSAFQGRYEGLLASGGG